MVKARLVARSERHQYWPQWTALTWLTIGLLTLVMTAACRWSVPAIDPAQPSVEASRTLSGKVRGRESAGTIGRIVEVVNVETKERQRATTDNAGGFTFRVKPGTYRVELALRDGESLLKTPGVMNVDHSGVEAHADFVVGAGPASRPRGPAYRTDDGLGSPIG